MNYQNSAQGQRSHKTEAQLNGINKLSARVAAVQLVSGTDISHNLQRATYWIQKAAGQGAELVVLPENFCLLESRRLITLGQQENRPDGQIRAALSTLAKENSIWLIAGSLPCSVRPDGSEIDNKVRSSCWVFNDQGDSVARYDKIHLFDVDVEDGYGSYRESTLIEPGTDVVTANTPFGKTGLSICYDLRFPELYRELALSEANVIVVPSAFTYKTGMAHWEVLVRARAIENQVFIIAANQGGRHSDRRETFGHSMIVDPWGKVIATQIETGEGMIMAELNFQQQAKLRQSMPVLTHRQL